MESRKEIEKNIKDYEWEIAWRQRAIEKLKTQLVCQHEPKSNYCWLDTCAKCGITTE